MSDISTYPHKKTYVKKSGEIVTKCYYSQYKKQKKSYEDVDIAELSTKISMGVPINRICKDYGISYYNFKKLQSVM